MYVKKIITSKKTLITLCALGLLASTSTALSANSIDAPAINCQFPVAEPVLATKKSTVLQWADYAVTHTFTYDYENYNEQFTKVKPCFTNTGWKSFSDAIKASGNLEALTKQELVVSAKVKGTSKVVAQFGGKQTPFWLVRVPITITYQNEDNQKTEDINVDLNVKIIEGNPLRFGINQMVTSHVPVPVLQIISVPVNPAQ